MRWSDRVFVLCFALHQACGSGRHPDVEPSGETADTTTPRTDTGSGEIPLSRDDCVRARVDLFLGERPAKYATYYLLYDPLEPPDFGVEGWYAARLPTAPSVFDFPPGRLLRWTWDDAIGADSPDITTYHYDAAGRIAHVDYPTGWQDWTFDSLDRLSRYEEWSLHGDSTTVMEYAFGEGGLLTLLNTFRNDLLTTRTSFTYDELGNMVYHETDGGQSWGPDGVVDEYYLYTYDDAGRILTKEGHSYASANHWRYTYDDRGRRVGELFWALSPALPYWRCTAWTYDDRDRVLTSVEGCLGAVVREASYAYDERGNLLEIMEYDTLADWSETWTWTYDNQNRRTTFAYVLSDSDGVRAAESEEWTYSEAASCTPDNDWP